MKDLIEYTLDELELLHPDDINEGKYGFTTGEWEQHMAVLRATGTPCEGCKHVVMRFPYPSMCPCGSCARAFLKDLYESVDGSRPH